ELELDFEFDRKGSIMVCEREVDLAAAHSTVAWLGGEGVRGRVLDSRELRELEPNLADDLAGGALFPDDVQVEPRLATVALVEAARARGAEVETEAEALGVHLSAAGRGVGLGSNRGWGA